MKTNLSTSGLLCASTGGLLTNSAYGLFTPDYIPSKAKKLIEADLLVELHPFKSFSLSVVEKELRNRFMKTHNIVTIARKDRNIDYYFDICNQNLSRNEIKASVDEQRPDINQVWFWITRKI